MSHLCSASNALPQQAGRHVELIIALQRNRLNSNGAHQASAPSLVLKLFVGLPAESCIPRKMEKWKNGKVYSGSFSRIQFLEIFHFSIFPFLWDSGTDSWRVSVKKSVRPGHRPPKKWKNGKMACHNLTLTLGPSLLCLCLG